MDATERLCAAVLTVVPVCDPNDYDGDQEIYCTYRNDYEPDVFAEGSPDVILLPFILDLFLPRGMNPKATLQDLCAAVAAAGFTWPRVENGTVSGEPQHYVLTFEGTDDDGGI